MASPRRKKLTDEERRRHRQEYMRKYRVEYMRRPGMRERGLEWRRKYDRKPEVKERKREYQQRPEVKERARELYKEYVKNPEFRERRRKANLKYMQKPEVREYNRLYNRLRYRKPETQARLKKYYQLPKVKKRLKQYYRSLDAHTRARMREKNRKRSYKRRQMPIWKTREWGYRQEYFQRPGVRERHRKVNRENVRKKRLVHDAEIFNRLAQEAEKHGVAPRKAQRARAAKNVHQ